MNTETRIREWLADEANVHLRTPAAFPERKRGLEDNILRLPFVTSNGHSLSVQQGASHYCGSDSVELWYCPHRPILEPYNMGVDAPYAYVPIEVLAAYIDMLETEERQE